MKAKAILVVASAYLGLSAWIVAAHDAARVREYREQNIAQLDVCFQDSWHAHAVHARSQAHAAAAGWLGWAYRLPPGQPLVLAALAFGVAGSVTAQMRRRDGLGRSWSGTTLGGALAGAFAGLLTLGLALAIAQLWSIPPRELPGEPLVVGCLLAGVVAQAVARRGPGCKEGGVRG